MTDANATTSANDTENNVVKITPANRAVIKTLKDLNIKKARADHHRTLLTSAIQDGKTIGGLRRDIRPQVPDIPVEFAIEWEEAHIVFTDTLTKILVKYWNHKRDVIDTELAATTSKLAIGTSDQETAHINSLSVTTFDQEVTKLQAPKPQRPPRQWLKAKRRKPGGDSGPGNNSGQ
jgi:hypothetical protein